MQWGAFFATAAIVAVIVFLQWPRMKKNPKKDKAAFIVILAIGLVLSMFNLQYMKGPVSYREDLLKPFVRYLQE